MLRIDTSRVIIVGAGLAAHYAALKLAPRAVLMISPGLLGEDASSVWAQGGVSAAMDPRDSAASHAQDTIRAGAGTVNPQVARQVTEEARGHILDLTGLGAPFDRTSDGSYILSREAAHGFARVVRVCGDQAGAGIMRVLSSRVRASDHIQVLEGAMAMALSIENGTVTGVEVARCVDGLTHSVLIRGAAVLLAGGGSGGLYALTTNPSRIRGEVIGMAARAGAVIADAEFVQFHPTAIVSDRDPAALATEALRGAGATLINCHGERFMLGVHPDAELAPRDIVARAVYAQTQAGMAPALDTRQALGSRLLTEFPAVAAACHQAGIDPVANPIPVAAAAHYHMGGVATDQTGKTSLSGLWACGEVASTGLHGANRLASNGLLEALVFGSRCALDIGSALGPYRRAAPEVSLPDLAAAPEPAPRLVSRLRQSMTDGAGVIRHAQGLQQTLDEIVQIQAEQSECLPLLNMTAAATLIAKAALNRRESRGAHFRSDYPETDGATGRRSFLTLTDARAQHRPAPLETT